MTPADKPAVALFGASVRALAQSAAAAGFRVFGCDLFADLDLLECCEQVVRLDRRDYPDGFKRAADAWPGLPRVYTGGLENHPEVVAHFARTGPLWGCSSEVLQACRAPTALQDSGVPTPPVALSPLTVPPDGTWLLKPEKGSAGRGIRPWFGGELPPGCFLQQRVRGEARSATFLALPDQTMLIGAATQLIDEPWTGAPPFAYAGGSAPVPLSPPEARRLQQTGDALRSRFSLRGLFGVDAVRNGEDWTVVELNPRPTASLELFELTGLPPAFALLAAAFTEDRAALKPFTRTAGKAILYASRQCRLLEPLPSTEATWSYADRPAPGAALNAGDPVATVLAFGASPMDVEEYLKRGIERLRARLNEE